MNRRTGISNKYYIYSYLLLLLCCSLLFASPALACSGPHAMETINGNFQKAVLLAIPAGAMEVAGGYIYFKTRWRASLGPFVLSTLLFALHPAWTVSAMIGDCGQAKLAAAILFTSSIFGLFVAQMGILLWKRRLVTRVSHDVKEA